MAVTLMNKYKYDPNMPDYIFGRLYVDNGAAKWGGFYLSDHTAILNKQASEKSEVEHREMKPEMTFDEIATVMSEAIRKNRPVLYQTRKVEIVNGEQVLPPVKAGLIKSYADDLLIIGDEKMTYEDVRWISLND